MYGNKKLLNLLRRTASTVATVGCRTRLGTRRRTRMRASVGLLSLNFSKFYSLVFTGGGRSVGAGVARIIIGGY